MLVRERQAGFMLGEVLLVLALLMIIGAHAVPQAAKFFRQTAVEYEAEKLLSTIRYCQNLSRTTADNAWGYGAKNPNKRDIYLQLSAEGNQIFAGEGDIIVSHNYLPQVNVVKVYQENGKNHYDDLVNLAFNANGQPKSLGKNMMTILIYYQGYPAEGQKIMISKGGRIRMERGNDEP
ncbi:hypothetical protein [Selenomonas ruminantium]|uniref:hypothetical protein n=1 Tax=Selenomonas ruminantium TaxID=971 RepID=UPI00047B1B22|nr:hypothetical protein [Selenomonas ruminantium]